MSLRELELYKNFLAPTHSTALHGADVVLILPLSRPCLHCFREPAPHRSALHATFFFGTAEVSCHCIGTFSGISQTGLKPYSCLFPALCSANPVAPPAADPLLATPSPRLRASSPSREDDDGPGDVGSPFPTEQNKISVQLKAFVNTSYSTERTHV